MGLFFSITCYYSGLIFYIVKGWYVYPAFPCLSWMVCLIYVMVMSVQLDACWWSLYSFCGGLGHQSQYICGVVWGGSCAGFGVFLARLSNQVDPGVIVPLQDLHDTLMYRHPGPPDAPVCGPHQSYGNPTLDVSTRRRVRLLPLCCELSGYPF